MQGQRSARIASIGLLSIAALALGACSSGSSTFDQSSLQKSVTDALQKQVGQRPASVACPGDVSSKKGTTFRCTITADDGSTIGLSGTVKDDKGNFDIVVDSNVATPPTSK